MEYTEKKENVNSFNEDYFKSRFKKKLLGGYNPNEVIDFINAMHSNFQNSEQNLRRNIMKLTQDKQVAENELESFRSSQNKDYYELKSELESALSELDKKNELLRANAMAQEELPKKLSEAYRKYDEEMAESEHHRHVLEETLEDERKRNAELTAQVVALQGEIERLNLHVRELENQSDPAYIQEKVEDLKMEAFNQVNEEKRVNFSLQNEVKALQNRIVDLKNDQEAVKNELQDEKRLRSEMEDMLNLEKKKYSDLQINGFRKEFNGIQQFLEDLSMEHEIKNKELELELELEREKAEKAEERIQNLLMKYSTLKDKVLWEKKQFMSKLSELADGHSKFVADLNLVLTEVTHLDNMEASNQ